MGWTPTPPRAKRAPTALERNAVWLLALTLADIVQTFLLIWMAIDDR